MVVSPTNSKAKNGESKERGCSSCGRTKMVVLERRSLTSLYIYDKSDRQRSSGQEGELLYAERASCGYRICEFLKNSER